MQFRQILLLTIASLSTTWSGTAQQRESERPITSLIHAESLTLPHCMIIKDTTASYMERDVLLHPLTLGQSHQSSSTPIMADESGWFAREVISQSQRVLKIYRTQLFNNLYSAGTLRIYGQQPMSLFVDGQLAAQSIQGSSTDTMALLAYTWQFPPGNHQLEIRHLSLPSDSTRRGFRITLEPSSGSTPEFAPMQKKQLDLAYMMSGKSISGVRLSPSGKYALVIYSSQRERKTEYFGRLIYANGTLIRESKELVYAQWMPRTDQLHLVRTEGDKRLLIVQSPLGDQESILLKDLPEGSYKISPDAKKLYFAKEVKGDAKDDKVIRMRDPNDRIPSWRDASQWVEVDLITGIQSPLTSPKENIGLLDIAASGKLLFARYTTDWTREPYDFSDLYQFDPRTGQVDTLVRSLADLKDARYVPNNPDLLLITGSPNAFEGVGKELPKEQMANGFEGELFLYSLSTGKIQTPSLHFAPSVEYGSFDSKGFYYFIAENGSRKHLYKLDTSRALIHALPVTEDYVGSLSVAYLSGDYWYHGQSATRADALYAVHREKPKKIWDLDPEKMVNYERPTVQDFTYTTPQGTPIEGWYYLPPHFDANKKYPMLVYYYGGTSPTSRRMEGTYSLAMYAALGYVVYTLNPSGCTGYGQEFAARHLNAWGEPTATEIIEATKAFCKAHPFVDASKIGCFGASYGGFMTQYLQTKGNTFAAAVSHAGISSISNYWGSGYWGIGYNAIAAQGSYPWSRKDIYVDRSPLFNADKIHTPLLLLHGDSDTNVPTSESVNLYNALKVLGREVELIEFTEQDHFILEPERREKWTASIQAWFARFLQGDSTWWEQLYGN